MKTKLTITIDKAVIEQAKKYASKQGRSLSSMIENYLKAVTSKEEKIDSKEELSPIVKSLMMRPKINLPKDYDYKVEIAKIRDEKYKKYLENE